MLATCSSGIGALLLEGGTTVHSRFKVPVPLKPGSSLNIPLNSPLAALLKKAVLILWDEATMQDRQILEMLDTFLRELMGVDAPFGGKLLLLTG